MSTIKDLEARYNQLNDDFNVFTSRTRPASAEQIETYQRETGMELPAGFINFLSNLGQLVIEVKEAVWRRPEEMEALPMWKFGYGFYVFGLSQNTAVPDWLNYGHHFQNEEAAEKGQQFFQRSGNMYRAYMTSGEIKIELDHYGDDIEIFEGNIYDFIIAEIDKLESDYKKYVTEAE